MIQFGLKNNRVWYHRYMYFFNLTKYEESYDMFIVDD